MAVDLEAAKATLMEYAGLDEQHAEQLLRAVLAAAEREALELLAGDAPVPSSMADVRALRLRYVSEHVGRALNRREVEVILRVSPTSALSMLRRMNATYPRAVDGFLRELVRQSATITKTGNQESGYRYQIYFDDPAPLEYAYQLLQRKGMVHDVRIKRAEQTLDLPRTMSGEDPLRVLELPAPI